MAVLACVVTFCGLSGVALAEPPPYKLTGTLTFSDVGGVWDHHGSSKVSMIPDAASGGWMDDNTSTFANSFLERDYKVGANSDPICAADGQLVSEYNAAGEGVWSQLPSSSITPQFKLRSIGSTYVELDIDAPRFQGTFMTTYNVFDANHECVGTRQEITPYFLSSLPAPCLLDPSIPGLPLQPWSNRLIGQTVRDSAGKITGYDFNLSGPTGGCSTYKVSGSLKIAKGFSILTPTDGQQLNMHLQQVEPGTIDFSWTSLPDATKYLVSLLDTNSGKHLKQNADMGQSTSFSLPTKDFTFGHEYEFTATAVTPSQQFTDTHSFKIKVLPDLPDALSQQLEQHQIIWEPYVAPELIQARNAFAQALQAKHWTIHYNSAYRTLYFQEHLYLIVEGLKDDTLSAADIALLQTEKTNHGLGTKVAKPSSTAPHYLGIAFDANIYDQNGQPLNGFTWIDNQVLELAKQAGFKKPPHDDQVHFQLQ